MFRIKKAISNENIDFYSIHLMNQLILKRNYIIVCS